MTLFIGATVVGSGMFGNVDVEGSVELIVVEGSVEGSVELIVVEGSVDGSVELIVVEGSVEVELVGPIVGVVLFDVVQFSQDSKFK